MVGMPRVVKSVELASGVTLPYVEQGDPSGIPVVLLHGVTDSWRSFELVLPLMPSSLHVFALTQRGHGDAERPAEGYRTRDFAADIVAFFDALNLSGVVLVGHSMGGTNAQRVAIDHGARLAGLVLVDSFAGFRWNAGIVDFCEHGVFPLADPVDPAFIREFQESTFARPVPPAFVDLVVSESMKVPAHVWRAAFAGFLEDDVAGEWSRIDVPTLLVWGDRDAYVPRADQDTLREAIPGSRLLVYEGTGHTPHWEEPARFVADLVAFVEQLGIMPRAAARS
jgi:non-heme chloroperoxidase